jgi:hypothetical protein
MSGIDRGKRFLGLYGILNTLDFEASFRFYSTFYCKFQGPYAVFFPLFVLVSGSKSLTGMFPEIILVQ